MRDCADLYGLNSENGGTDCGHPYSHCLRLNRQTGYVFTAFLLQGCYSDDGSRGVDEPTEAPRLKRRRRLQYSSSDADIGISDELLASEPVKSKVGRIFKSLFPVM